MINEKEKEKLIQYLTKEKNNYIININNYLQSSQFELLPNLSTNIILKEGGLDIYKEKIMKEIQK